MTEVRKRIADIDELRRLGVPEVFSKTSQYYAEKGAFNEEPRPQLIEDTIAVCLEELRRKPGSEISAELERVTDSQIAYLRARDSFLEIKHLGRLPSVYAASVWYLLANAEPPLLMVENHNHLPVSWWKDEQFVNIRVACGKINHLAQALNQPVSSRVVVLKQDASQYTLDELEGISELHRDATSDVYWISARHAGSFAEIDELVVGDQCVMRMIDRPETPMHAVILLLSSIVEDSAQAATERERICSLMNRSIPVIVGGHIRPEFKRLIQGAKGARDVIEMVVSEQTIMS